jgi:large subunit ribosomal protein L6e
VLLRQLLQGVLLITGPFKSNGVPLRRVNHRYVIATSTIVDVSGIEDEVLDRVAKDEYWAKEKGRDGKGEDDFFKEGEAAQVRAILPPIRHPESLIRCRKKRPIRRE